MIFFLKFIPSKATHNNDLTILRNWGTGKQFIGKRKTSRATKASEDLMWRLKQFRPREPFQDPLSLSVTWIFPWKKSHSKKIKDHCDAVPCDTRSDLDNLAKGLLDCMTRTRFWNDDAQIYNLNLTKYWGKIPGILIEIELWNHQPITNLF